MIWRISAVACILASLLTVGSGHASAQASTTPPLIVTASLSTNHVILGERFRLTVIIVHPADILVSLDPPQRSAALQLVEVIPSVDTPAGPSTGTRFEYVLAAFDLGTVSVPPQRVAWLNADGLTGTTQVAAPPLTVAAVSPDTVTTLRPLRPQLDVTGAPRWWERYAPYAVGALAVLAAAVVAARRWQARPRRAAITVAPPSEAETSARQRLDVLAASDPLSRRDYDTYYGTIAEVVRDYLQARFGFGARALTTTELQQRMVTMGVERWQARLVSGLLDRCDAAVYARSRPDPSSADHDLTVAYEVIELSRPVEAVAV